MLSDLLGWASIACWLGAQFPQVLENIRRQSCEGLALPFLLNWLLGDITNLIGCLLTHQLPFQTILATYFVSVDFMLFSQYFYYRSKAPKELTGGMETASASPVQRYSTHGRRFSTEHDHHYRELSNAATNVAIAAALAASEEELHHAHGGGREGSTSTITGAAVRPMHRRLSTSMTQDEEAEAEDEVDEDALAALADSFHSESGRKRVSWSQERYSSATSASVRGGSTSQTRSAAHAPLHASLLMTSGDGAAPATIVGARGRPLQRQVVDSPIDDAEDFERHAVLGHGHGRSISRSAARDRRSSRASQRSVGLVFLGVWALFGVGGTFTQRAGSLSLSLNPRGNGNVLSVFHPVTPTYTYKAAPSATDVVLSEEHKVKSVSDDVPSYANQSHDDEEEEEPSSERIIGRMFAWACTTLYLTSRLPQIWKNFVRKSVEGLSMYLFVFAFLGNTFYVLSILTSPLMSQPKPASTAFLLESTPYLLGSGGTLLFDITIVTQSFLYRVRPGRPQHHRHRSSYSRSRTNSHMHGTQSQMRRPTEDEERALLSSSSAHDLEHGIHESENEWTQPQSRRRVDGGDGGETL